MIKIKQINFIKLLIALLTILFMTIALATPAIAAKEYKISFKAGSKGIYNDQTTSRDYMVGATSNLPVAPDTIVASLQIEPGYYFNGWNYTVKQTGVAKSANYVAQYKRIVDEAVYRVNYVDEYGNQLATQKVITSNIGIVVAENAINIEGYAVDQLTKSATVAKTGTEITFNYVSTVNGDVDTIIENEVVVVAGTGTANGTGAGTGTAGTNGTDTDNAAGTTDGAGANTAGGTGGLGTEEVPQDKTPLAGKDKDTTKTSSSSNGILIGGGIIVLALIAGAGYIYKKRI